MGLPLSEATSALLADHALHPEAADFDVHRRSVQAFQAGVPRCEDEPNTAAQGLHPVGHQEKEAKVVQITKVTGS